jgi:hypothetical protein
MAELNEADMADYLITGYGSGGIPDRKIRAAYVTGDDTLPRTFVFKNHKHQVVALVNQDAVLTVERLDGTGQTGRAPSGFQPTTQVMEKAGIRPGDVP